MSKKVTFDKDPNAADTKMKTQTESKEGRHSDLAPKLPPIPGATNPNGSEIKNKTGSKDVQYSDLVPQLPPIHIAKYILLRAETRRGAYDPLSSRKNRGEGRGQSLF